jgi:hypothetical protein
MVTIVMVVMVTVVVVTDYWFICQGYCTVSHFNIVHYDCHMAAVRYDDVA